mgnify:CR=1 FL=1
MPGEATSPASSLVAHLDLAKPIRQHRRHGVRVVGGIVTVDITCTTGNDDLAAVAAPSRTFTGRGAAVIDTYRAGTP